ncbi:MAG: hypothetical protein ACTSPL_03745 [Candidatus Odinarchaeia archaeon]
MNYEGLMYELKGRQIGFEITPEHRLLISRQIIKENKCMYDQYKFLRIFELKNYRKTQRWRFPYINKNFNEKVESSTINLLDFLPKAFLRISASIPRFDLKLKEKNIPYKLIGAHHRFAVRPKYISKILTLKKFIREILVQYLPNSPMINLDVFLINKNPFLKVAGIYVAEGSSKSPKSYEVNLAIFDEKIKREICEELDKMRVKYKVGKRGISFSGWLAYILATQFGRSSRNKKIPQWIFDLPANDKKLFLNWMYKGDGHKKYTRYTTTSKTLFNHIIKLLIEIGFIPRYYKNEKTKNGKTIYRIVWQRNYSTFSWKDNISEKWYKGKIYCLTVKDNHTVLAGTDGKFQFIGQSYGKYHYDGHRKCNVCLHPKESIKLRNICPACGKKLTIGVLHRVEELADRPEGFQPSDAIPFKKLLPLGELIKVAINVGNIYSKKIWNLYSELVNKFGNEFEILLNVPINELSKICGAKLANLIKLNREEKLVIKPGYDGVYGEIVYEVPAKEETKTKYGTQQKSLSDFY